MYVSKNSIYGDDDDNDDNYKKTQRILNNTADDIIQILKGFTYRDICHILKRVDYNLLDKLFIVD